MHKAVYLCSVS